MTNTARVLDVLKAGEALTAKQITARFKIANPGATISALRAEGFPIYLNKHVDSKGRETSKYRLGTPSRKLIAAGYKALGAEAFA
jgi:Helix-turn-helix domain